MRDSHAYWLTVSPTPGQLGPATIIGHVDSAAYGPGVFFKLGDLRQRDKIYVTRSDGTVAMFEIERVAEYKKAHFPTHEVYGNIDHAGLRLITCGGTFDPSIRSYESNIVVYAALVSAHPDRAGPFEETRHDPTSDEQSHVSLKAASTSPRPTRKSARVVALGDDAHIDG